MNKFERSILKIMKKLVRKNPILGLTLIFGISLVFIAGLALGIYTGYITDENVAGVETSKYTDKSIVTKVIDGDTIEVTSSDEKFKVRLIGVNTPETVDPRRDVECFGLEASNFLKSLLLNQEVELSSDETQDQTDRYGRALRYIYLNGENVNLKIIAEGYGYEYTYKVPYLFQAKFKEAERNAREKSLGLWGDICQKL